MKQILKVQMQKIMANITFPQALAAHKNLDDVCELASQHLNTFPKGEMGLTADEVKASNEWRCAKLSFDVSFQNLRNFNQYYTKQFKRELAQMRDEKRKARVSTNIQTQNNR